MSHQSASTIIVRPGMPTASLLPPVVCTRGTTLGRLKKAFQLSHPLTVLIGETPACSQSLLDHFFADLDEDVSVVRLQGPFSDEVSLMSEIIQSIGFESEGLSLADLDNVFTMYLAYQKTHEKRVVVCLEQVQDNGVWLLERIYGLAESESDKEFGLMTIATGRPSLHEQLNHCAQAETLAALEQRIAIAPLSLAETRDFIKSHIEKTDKHDITQVFEFDAITRIHELSEGAFGTISSLYRKSRELWENDTQHPISPELVEQANAAMQVVDTDSESANDDTNIEISDEHASWPEKRRLIVRMHRKKTKELHLDRGHILIGRDKLCNIRIISPSVSRHHALIVNTASGISIIDLASTNGTIVDGKAIRHCDLGASGEIVIGDHVVNFQADDDLRDWLIAIEQPDSIPIHDVHGETQTIQPPVKGNINSKGEKIYHVEGTAAYNATKIDESKGERYFLSEEEAEAAGWRAARR